MWPVVLVAFLLAFGPELQEQARSNTAAPAAGQEKPTPAASTTSPSHVFVDIELHGANSFTEQERTTFIAHLSGETARPDWFDRLRAKADRELLNFGFLDGKVDAQQLQSVQSGGIHHVLISLNIEEGPRYRVKEVKFPKATAFTREQLEAAVAIHPGDTFSADSISSATTYLKSLYSKAGYQDVAVMPSFSKLPEQREVVLYVTMDEGTKSGVLASLECSDPHLTGPGDAAFSVPTYDDTRDAQMDLARARMAAHGTGKRILLIAGGKWCAPCMQLERVFSTNEDLTRVRDSKFVLLHVDGATEKGAECVLTRLQKSRNAPLAYPAIFLLDPDGNVLRAQGIAEWEELDGISASRILASLQQW
jgi:hypothetical protein